MDALKDLDIKNIEIRREFLKNFDDELEDIRKKSEAYGMNIFYSVPEWLYKKNKLMVIELETYFKEAHKMDCRNVKLNIGEVDLVYKEDIEILNKLADKYKINITVENDQTVENGRSDKIYNFLTQVKQLKGNISFTFDIGNWLFQNEDPLKNTELLNSFVTYIHVKDIDKDKKTVTLNDGILDWKNILSKLPQNLPVALEYPCGTVEQLVLEIEKILKY